MVYQRRFELFRQVYLHKTCQAIDLMIADALVQANQVYHFEEVIFSPEKYLRLMHDDLLNVIKKSKDPRLKESSELLKRIDTRDLFKMVGEASINKANRGRVMPAEICKFSADLNPTDLVVLSFKLDWGNGEEYPLDRINFFDSRDTSTLCKLTKFEAHQYRPQQCFDHRIRVFVRDAAKRTIAKKAFETYMDRVGKSLMFMLPHEPSSVVRFFPVQAQSAVDYSKQSAVVKQDLRSSQSDAPKSPELKRRRLE